MSFNPKDLPQRYQAQIREQTQAPSENPSHHPETDFGIILAVKPSKHKNGFNPVVVLSWLIENDIAVPEFEHRFCPDRRWRFDMAWPAHKLALECQGGIWTQGRHNRGAAMIKEWEKLNAAAIDGWRLIYCQPSDLCSEAFATVIKKAIAHDKLSHTAPTTT